MGGDGVTLKAVIALVHRGSGPVLFPQRKRKNCSCEEYNKVERANFISELTTLHSLADVQ